MLFKACPKCRGDLAGERDVSTGRPELVCLQCGYTAPPEERTQFLIRALNRRRTSAAAIPAPVPVRHRRVS